MNDFRVIKCQNCDAGLTELAGQKLLSCVQCGYDFNTVNKTGRKRSRRVNGLKRQTIQQPMDASVQYGPKKTSAQIQATPELKALVRKLKDMKRTAATKSQTSKKTSEIKSIPKKKKGFPVGTIIFWIILFNILKGVFGW